MFRSSNYPALRAKFIDAAPVDINELSGRYLVDILLIPGYRFLSHIKVFSQNGSSAFGYNKIFGLTWGHFVISKGSCRDLDFCDAVVINYGIKKNFPPLRGIRDYLRCLHSGRSYIGRFYYQLGKRQLFLGYFTLNKL
ncbi:MAG: hypothetical protein ISR96_04510 [Nitrospira sp.]|nr:hypothetical protein [Nitrospira sp.]